MKLSLKYLPVVCLLSTLAFLGVMILIFCVRYGTPSRFITISDLGRSFLIPETTIMASGMAIEGVFLIVNAIAYFMATSFRYYRKQKLATVLRHAQLLCSLLGAISIMFVGVFTVSGFGWLQPHNFSAGLFFLFTTLSNILMIINDWGVWVKLYIEIFRILICCCSTATIIAYSTSFKSKLAYDNLCEWIGVVLMFICCYSTFSTYKDMQCNINIISRPHEMPEIKETRLGIDDSSEAI